ncbi:Zn-ribbon domain-containing OB-fold protein [Nocardia rhamnosiphila]|uniref:OB-fold domain-containing protein n=1 Tax=Nocardia rhamnosiphila TaxID=426716 RepID=A0ABV2WLP4_9NOCA|nr:OB-fold domain-containing protein [Nocardia rhamnosiphila]
MTAPSPAAKPLPLADDITAPYWAAARERRLCLQFCRGCDHFVHLPAAFCPRCTSAELIWRDVSGRATLYSYTVMHDAPAPGFAGSLPYLVGIAELVEQPGLLLTADLLEASPDELAIGMPLEVIFEELAPDSIVPRLRPRSA